MIPQFPEANGEIIYNPIFLFGLSLITASVLYVTRNRWLPMVQTIPDHLPSPFRRLNPAYYRLSGHSGGSSSFLNSAAAATTAAGTQLQPDLESGSFFDDIRSGFSSRHFDLNTNLSAGDSRQGLDSTAKEEIAKLMQQNKGVNFDEARRLYFQKKMQDNGIGPDGLPNDPKAFFFR